jgi:hypothetical protein
MNKKLTLAERELYFNSTGQYSEDKVIRNFLKTKNLDTKRKGKEIVDIVCLSQDTLAVQYIGSPYFLVFKNESKEDFCDYLDIQEKYLMKQVHMKNKTKAEKDVEVKKQLFEEMLGMTYGVFNG